MLRVLCRSLLASLGAMFLTPACLVDLAQRCGENQVFDAEAERLRSRRQCNGAGVLTAPGPGPLVRWKSDALGPLTTRALTARRDSWLHEIHQPRHCGTLLALRRHQTGVPSPGLPGDVTPKRDALDVRVIPEHLELTLHDGLLLAIGR